MLKKPDFQCKVKAPYEYFFVFLSFMNTFSEAAALRCSSKQMLLKISQYSELTPTQVFSCPSCEYEEDFKEQLFYRTSQVAAFVFFFSKEIKQPFRNLVMTS